jgi:putative ABC transport system substrate-binding protein
MKLFSLHTAIVLIFLVSAQACGEVLVIQSLPIKPYDDAFQGFKSTCKEKIDRLVGPELNETEVATRVRRARPELILAIGMDAVVKLKGIKDIPIVYVMVLNPNTILNNGDNITGISMNLAPEKQFSVMRELLPQIKKIGIIFDQAKTGPYVGRVYNAASIMGIELMTKQVHSSKEALSTLEGMAGKVDALWLIPDTTVVNPTTVDLLLLSSIEKKLPVITFSEKYAEKGALLALEVDAFQSGKQAGEMAEKILAGKSASAVKNEDSRGVNLTVNMVVAKKLGIPIKTNMVKHARIIR